MHVGNQVVELLPRFGVFGDEEFGDVGQLISQVGLESAMFRLDLHGRVDAGLK